MSQHRLTDPTRIRQAHGSLDPGDATERIATARRIEAQRDARATRDADYRQRVATDPINDTPPPGMVLARLAHSAVIPSILQVACADHGADVGQFCYTGARGVCGARAARSHLTGVTQ